MSQKCKIEDEGNVLFNAALNTFLIQLYGVGKIEEKENMFETCNLLHALYLFCRRGAGCSSEVECLLMVRWVVGSILHGVDP